MTLVFVLLLDDGRVLNPQSPRKPGSDIRRTVTSPSDLVAVGSETELKLPGFVPEKESLATSQSSANLRPTSGRTGYYDRGATDDDDDEIPL